MSVNESESVHVDDQALSDWSASDGAPSDSLDTLSTKQSRQRTPPLVTRSKAKQSTNTPNSLQPTSPAKQLSTRTYQGSSRFKVARSGNSTAIDLGLLPSDTQRRLEVMEAKAPDNEITVTLSGADYQALLRGRDLGGSAKNNETTVQASSTPSSASGQSEGVVPAASSDSSLRGGGTASAIPGFLQGPESKSDVVVHSSDSDSTNIRGVAFVDKGKKRKRSESPSATVPNFLQGSAGKLNAKAATSTRAPVQINAREPVHGDTAVLRVVSLPPSCEVNSIELQDVNCTHTYKTLPNLRKGTFASWSSTPGEGLMLMSALPEICASLNGGALWNAFLFARKGYHVNLSRVDPRILEAVAPVPPGGQTKYTLCIDGRTALCVSVCVVDESALKTGAAKGNARRQKFVSCILFSQEFQRLVAVCCMVFRKDVLNASLARDALTFGTGLEAVQASPVKKAKITSNARLASTSTSHSKSPMSAKDMLRFEDSVPIYDGRHMDSNFEDCLDCLSDTLPAYTENQGEVAPGSVVAVGYVVNQYESGKRGSAVGFNINWVVVLGDPRET